MSTRFAQAPRKYISSESVHEKMINAISHQKKCKLRPWDTTIHSLEWLTKDWSYKYCYGLEQLEPSYTTMEI